MQAKELISEMVPALRTSDTGLKALSYMDIFRISHLPIVNNTEFLGLISDKDIYDMNMAEEPIGNHTLSLTRSAVTCDQHIYEVIELAARFELTVIPVLDDKNNYLGIITQTDLLKYFSDKIFICKGIKRPLNTCSKSLRTISHSYHLIPLNPAENFVLSFKRIG